MCGKATRYEIVTSAHEVTPETWSKAKPLSGAPEPAEAGTAQSMTLPTKGVKRYIAIRAIDEQGNVGLPENVRYYRKARRERKKR